MKVALFPDMKAEGWPSMNRYAQFLRRQFSILNYPVSSFSAEPPLRLSKVRLFWRNFVFPRLAGRNQGAINHILDHSYAHLLGFLEPGKTVVTCHDLIPLEYEKDENIRRQFVKVITSLERAVFIVADSQATKNDLREKLAIPEDRIGVVYLGVDQVFRTYDLDQKKRIVKRFKLPQGRFILSHGNPLAYKNVEGILTSFRKILLAEGSVFLLRVGPLTATQAGLVRDLGISERFLSIPNPTDEELAGLYNCADVFLSPSFKEGFGLTVLQALACGTPVVISKGTSLGEIAGETGIYVDSENSDDISRTVINILNSGAPDIRKKEAMILRAKDFTWEKTAKAMIQVYEKIHKQRYHS